MRDHASGLLWERCLSWNYQGMKYRLFKDLETQDKMTCQAPWMAGLGRSPMSTVQLTKESKRWRSPGTWRCPPTPGHCIRKPFSFCGLIWHLLPLLIVFYEKIYRLQNHIWEGPSGTLVMFYFFNLDSGLLWCLWDNSLNCCLGLVYFL